MSLLKDPLLTQYSQAFYYEMQSFKLMGEKELGLQNRDIVCGAVKSVPPNSWEEVKYRYFQYYRYPIYANFKKLFLVQDVLLLSVGIQLKQKQKKKRPKPNTQIHE